MTKSEQCWDLLQKLTPNGCQTLSKGPTRFVEGIYPKVLAWGKGGHAWDEDNNEYIDMISGLGAITVGYCNRDINRVVTEQLFKGVSFSLPNKLEYLVAERLNEVVPGTDMWKFTKTGSDATSMAIKCARAYTGREKVMVCGYHGWHDWYSIVNDKKAGIPKVLSKYIVKAKYNDLKSFSDLDTKDYAAVIMEPMVFDLPEKGFLANVKALCKSTGTVLIFDEVVTGGRFEKFTAQSYFKVTPDLTVLSKGIANGFPLAAVGGNRAIMQTFERDDFFASTTFGGECLSLAACLATLDILQEKLPEMVSNGLRIKDTFNRVYNEHCRCKGYPTRLTFDFPTKEHKALFMQEMCLQGVLIGYSNFVMADYIGIDIENILVALGISRAVIEKYWDDPLKGLKGKIPVEVFRLR